MDEILELLRTRRLGPFRLGATMAETLESAGRPEDRSPKNDIWKYGYVQVAFIDGVVWMIGLYPLDADSLPIRREVFLRAAAAAGIDVAPDPPLTFEPNQRAFRSEAGVSAVLDEHDRLVKVIAASTDPGA